MLCVHLLYISLIIVNLCKAIIIEMEKIAMTKNNNTIKYNQLLDDWLCATKLKTKESTYARYVHLIKSHISPYLGEYQISQLTSKIIENFITFQLKNGRLDHHGGLSSKTVSDILTVIKSTVEYSKYHDYYVSCNLKKLYIKKKSKEMRVLTKEEQLSLIKTLTENMNLSKFGVLLSLYTGVRIGELCALKWSDFCMHNSVLKISKTMQRIQETEIGALNKTKVIITDAKSKSSIREIPLPAFLLNIAMDFYSSPQAFILTGDANRYIEPRTLQNHFKLYINLSGIEKVNFHALRHTFATRCVEIGFEIKSLSEILGHSNINITLNRYVHPSFELKSDNMNKLTLNF